MVVAALTLGGCATRLGPQTIPGARFNYNDKIARSQNDQLLLNLVRLKYRDTLVFLDVGTVIAQYTLAGQVGAAPRINADGSGKTELGLDLGASYSEQPTITYEPLQGAEFTQRLLTPVSPFTLVLLSQSGWSIERLMLCCVEAVNGITNAPAASGPTPERLPDNSEFRELAGLLRELQVAGLLEFQTTDGEQGEAVLFHIASPDDEANPPLALARVRKLLQLDEQKTLFELTGRGLRRGTGEISVTGRSLLGALFFLSNGVDAPEEHERKGLVTVTKGQEPGRLDWNTVTGDLLKVSSAAGDPPDAFVRIRYRGHWFYISDSDLQSKATFNLLTYLFSLQAAGAEGGSPLLTVGVTR